MDRKSLLEQFEFELRQGVIDYEQGNTIALKDLDWEPPLHIAESSGEYRATNA